MLLEDYEIICPLNTNLNPTINSYKARKKLTEESYILHSIDFAKFHNDAEKEKLIKFIKERKEFQHPNLLKFITTFEDQPFKILYVVTEYCSNGNASSIINSCIKEKKYISEELICRIIYQIVCAIKTVKVFMGKLVLDEIFLDHDFNIKLLNFQPISKHYLKLKEIKVNKLARIMYQLSTLKKFDKSHYDSELRKIKFYYSTEFLSLLGIMIKDHNLLHKNIDKILCNTTLLLKSSQWRKEKSFFIVTGENHENESEAYLQHLKEKEDYLKVKEEMLRKKEHELILREKKLANMEKSLKPSKPAPTPWNDLDTSFSADCGDSVIIPTSKMLDNNIMRPPAFIRSKSERKVKFKGHSPLKNHNYNNTNRKSIRRPSTKNIYETIDKENIKQSDKSSLSAGSDSSSGKRNLFPDLELVRTECRPISWNGENKKQAFELLRMMNGQGQEEIKHTYL